MNELLQVLMNNEHLDINPKLRLSYNLEGFHLYVRVSKEKTKIINLTLEQVEELLNTSQASNSLELAYEKIMAEEERYLEFGDNLIEELEKYSLKNKKIIERIIAYISLAKKFYLTPTVQTSLEIDKQIFFKVQDKDKLYIYPSDKLEDLFKVLDFYAEQATERIKSSEQFLSTAMKRALSIDNYPTITESEDDISEIIEKLNEKEKRI